jgi:hypothetical protein
MRPDLQIDGTEVMWLEIKIKVGIILLVSVKQIISSSSTIFAIS